MCKEVGYAVAEKYYEHKPEKIVKTAEVTLMWDVTIITDRTIPAGRPDLVYWNKKKQGFAS